MTLYSCFKHESKHIFHTFVLTWKDLTVTVKHCSLRILISSCYNLALLLAIYQLVMASDGPI
jgi:hypothetical protein